MTLLVFVQSNFDEEEINLILEKKLIEKQKNKNKENEQIENEQNGQKEEKQRKNSWKDITKTDLYYIYCVLNCEDEDYVDLRKFMKKSNHIKNKIKKSKIDNK